MSMATKETGIASRALACPFTKSHFNTCSLAHSLTHTLTRPRRANACPPAAPSRKKRSKRTGPPICPLRPQKKENCSIQDSHVVPHRSTN